MLQDLTNQYHWALLQLVAWPLTPRQSAGACAKSHVDVHWNTAVCTCTGMQSTASSGVAMCKVPE